MAQKTTYYNLNKYETNDPADLRELSEGQDAIDLKLSKSTDMGYTDGGYLLGLTSLLSDYKYLAGDGFWYKLKSTTTSPYTHDASDTPDTVYLERITHKTTSDKVENLFTEISKSSLTFDTDGYLIPMEIGEYKEVLWLNKSLGQLSKIMAYKINDALGVDASASNIRGTTSITKNTNNFKITASSTNTIYIAIRTHLFE